MRGGIEQFGLVQSRSTSAASSPARSSVASTPVSSTVSSAAATGLSKSVAVDRSEFRMTFSGAVGLPQSLHALEGVGVRQVSTAGGGDCSVHACMGVAEGGSHMLRHPAPRRCIAENLPRELDQLRSRLADETGRLVTNVITELWTDFIVPHVDESGDVAPAPPEASMFLKLLTSSDNEQLLLDVRRQISQNNINVRAREDAMTLCLEQTGRIFTEDLKHVVWESIAVQRGLLPAPNASGEASHFEYLDEPWVWDEATRSFRVKGSNHIFLARPEGGPNTKFEALFDERSAFDGL